MQLLWKVQMPSALPTVMSGVNQTIMLALSMVVIASMIGGGGLGDVVLLPRRQDDPQRIAQAIDGDVDLARQAAARTSDGLILGPPFAPAAC